MSLVSGTVTLSLAEVDSLRDTIKQKEQQIADLEKEKEQIKSEKRILKIKEVRTDYKGAIEAIKDFKNIMSNGHMRDVVESMLNNISTFINRRETLFPSHYKNQFHDDVYGKASTTTKTEEYINMDDVKEEMYNEALKKLNDELVELRVFKQESMTLMAQKEARIQNRYNELVEEEANKYKELDKKHATLVQEFEDLKNDKVRISKEQELQKQLDELREELSKEKARKWYHKMFQK